ncbi:MAG: phage tail protein [Moraxellaceae bacterium]|nr:phage tail protein [Moraxellaceae bacterium]
MSTTYFSILTTIGEAKLANAVALGTQLRITHMAVGDGGGALPAPSPAQSTLVNEVRRAPLNELKPDPANPSQLIAEQVIPETVGGWWIREAGLIDEDGDLIVVCNLPPTYKPQLTEGSGRTQVVRIVSLFSSTANVQLKIDPAVVLATRGYVDDKISAELTRRDSKQSVRVATTAAIALNGLQTIDGIVLAVGDRVLVKNQAAGAENGIYTVAAGAWTRAADADTAIEVTPGLFVPVEQGTANADSLWQLSTDAPIVLGTTPLIFEMAAGRTGVAAGTYRSVTVNARGLVIGATNPASEAIVRLTTGQALPASNIGPIWHDDYNSLMTWQAFTANGAAYIGYASVLIGSLLADTQPTPRSGYIKSGIANLSRTTYAALRAWAIHNGFMVAEGVWASGRIAVKDNADGTTFTAYDVRGEFARFWDDGRGVVTGQSFGAWLADELKSHSHSYVTQGATANVSGDGSGMEYATTAQTGATGGTETRPRSVALLAAIKF